MIRLVQLTRELVSNAWFPSLRPALEWAFGRETAVVRGGPPAIEFLWFTLRRPCTVPAVPHYLILLLVRAIVGS